MALIDWNPVYSVKVKKFDDQHKKLIDLINELHDAMKAGQGDTMLGKILQSLVTYTQVNFGEEINTLQSCGYPELTRHKAELSSARFIFQCLRQVYFPV